MKKLKTKLIAIVSAVAISAMSATVAFLGSSAYADENSTASPKILITPTTQKISLDPGKSYTSSFDVINHGTVDFTFEVYASPFSVVGDDYNTNFEKESSYTEVYKWITFDDTPKKLAPNESQTINYTVNVPANAPGGGQYAAIFAETANPIDTNSPVQSHSRVGMLLYARLNGETKETGNILENSVPTIAFTPPISTRSLVQNTGNVHQDAKYILKVYPFASSEEVYTNEESPTVKTILPDSRLYSTESWDNAPSFGIFTVEQTVEFAGQVSTTSKLLIICPVWLLVIFAALILAVIFTIVSRARSRKQSRRESSASRSSSSSHSEKSEE